MNRLSVEPECQGYHLQFQDHVLYQPNCASIIATRITRLVKHLRLALPQKCSCVSLVANRQAKAQINGRLSQCFERRSKLF